LTDTLEVCDVVFGFAFTTWETDFVTTFNSVSVPVFDSVTRRKFADISDFLMRCTSVTLHVTKTLEFWPVSPFSGDNTFSVSLTSQFVCLDTSQKERLNSPTFDYCVVDSFSGADTRVEFTVEEVRLNIHSGSATFEDRVVTEKFTVGVDFWVFGDVHWTSRQFVVNLFIGRDHAVLHLGVRLGKLSRVSCDHVVCFREVVGVSVVVNSAETSDLVDVIRRHFDGDLGVQVVDDGEDSIF
jgi:hypothetical protein